MDNILEMFHHIHHFDGKHEVHHCGGRHKGLDYTINHCKCGKHSIDKEIAVGHDWEMNEQEVRFVEICPDGGWHVESGVLED